MGVLLVLTAVVFLRKKLKKYILQLLDEQLQWEEGGNDNNITNTNQDMLMVEVPEHGCPG